MSGRIGKYDITRRLGSGGMAEAFLVCNHGASGVTRELCIKKIRSEYSRHPEFIKHFQNEAKITAQLHHDNIVQVFEFSNTEPDESGDYFLVMEYVDGLDLDNVLTLTRDLGLQLPLDFAVYVLESLLSALDHAHTFKVDGVVTPVIHRDISPHNILLSTSGTVKLADFGIAKIRGISDATRTGVIKGKLAYLSPEQVRGGGAAVTTASDLFSAGLTFWETITCERLFQATMEHQLLAKVLAFDKASLPYYSGYINDFLAGLMAPDPANRFSSAESALLRLRKIGIPPCTARDAAQLVKQLKRHKKNAEIADAQPKKANITSSKNIRTQTAPQQPLFDYGLSDIPMSTSTAANSTSMSTISEVPKRHVATIAGIAVAACAAVFVAVWWFLLPAGAEQMTSDIELKPGESGKQSLSPSDRTSPKPTTSAANESSASIPQPPETGGDTPKDKKTSTIATPTPPPVDKIQEEQLKEEDAIKNVSRKKDREHSRHHSGKKKKSTRKKDEEKQEAEKNKSPDDSYKRIKLESMQ